MNDYIAFYGPRDLNMDARERLPEGICEFSAENNKKALEKARAEAEKWNGERCSGFSLIRLVKVEDVMS